MIKAKYTVHEQKGFTIVELMIGTAVLSTILVLATVTMAGIGRLYYKGINQAKIQNAVRTIANDVVQNIQVGSDVVVGPVSGSGASAQMKAYCIGKIRYSYIPGVKMGDTDGGITYQHVFWRDTISSGCSPANLAQGDPSSGYGGVKGTELMSPNSRLTRFTISLTSQGTYGVDVAAAYGDGDLLDLTTNPNNPTCRGDIGDQFCATASLQTKAVRRLDLN